MKLSMKSGSAIKDALDTIILPRLAERLKEPLVRKNGELQPVSWEEALQT